MIEKSLNIYKRPALKNPRLVLGFAGWMDGGNVSTGSVKNLIIKTHAQKFAEIDGQNFYIYSFPGPMEVTAMFRPRTKIQDGLIRMYQSPQNLFFASETHNLILFVGKEPNIHWPEFAGCILKVCQEFDVNEIYFGGSVTGLVPHTRAPRISCSCSDVKTKRIFEEYGFKFTDYDGPAGITTYMLALAAKKNIRMASLIAAIPVYVQGENPQAVNLMTTKLAAVLGLHLNLDDLHELANTFERKLSELVAEQPELADTIKKLEADYDNETFDTEMPDLKKWLLQKGVRVD